MSDQPQKLTGEQVDRARDAAQDYLQDNPDQARSLIDKVEDAIVARTGGRFSGMVDQAGAWAERQLDLPEDTPVDTQPSSEPPLDAPPSSEPPLDAPPSSEPPVDAPASEPPASGPGAAGSTG